MDSSVSHHEENIFMHGKLDTLTKDSMEKEILIVLMIINGGSGQESAK